MTRFDYIAAGMAAPALAYIAWSVSSAVMLYAMGAV